MTEGKTHEHSGRTRVEVPSGLYRASRFFARTRPLWRGLGNLETRALSHDIAKVTIDRPLYVTSLARAGTTIVTEMLASHPEVTCHRYSDFPNVWTPYWRNYLLQKTRRESPKPVERAHKDRIMVSQDSPEAVEEVLWMAWFEHVHNPFQSNVLDSNTTNTEFERFYSDHRRKLLAVRGANRYLAKGNYNISRLAYLHSLHPDARFLIPIRTPEHHIASLAKQHALFCQAHKHDNRVGTQLAMSGHFEFGPFRRAVHFGDDAVAAAIRADWEAGKEAEGWARYWSETYSFLARQLEASPSLAERCMLFRYEDLCARSESVIDGILEHCALPTRPFAQSRAHYAAYLTPPEYYQPSFSEEETRKIGQLTHESFERVGEFCFRP